MKRVKINQIIAGIAVFTTIFTSVPVFATGWKNNNGNWSYENSDGSIHKGWIQEGRGNWYYLNNNGIMQTGWVNDNGIWYYLNSSGRMATGWVQWNNTWYYLKNSGAMQTGWINDNGTWYYADNSGAMQTGVIKIDGKIYSFTTSGSMQIGQAMINNKIYVFSETGELLGDKVPEITKEIINGSIINMNNTNQQENNNSKVTEEKTSTNSSSSSSSNHHHSSSSSSSSVTKYTIIFDTNGGAFNNNLTTYSLSIKKGQTVQLNQLPENPTREGYIFEGWYSDKEFTKKFSYEESVINSNMTVYAKWKAIENEKDIYKFTFNTNGGAFEDSSTNYVLDVPSGTNIDEVEALYDEENDSSLFPENPHREGYIFIGWYIDLNSEDEYYYDEMFEDNEQVRSDLTLYAKWEAVNETTEGKEELYLDSVDASIVYGEDEGVSFDIDDDEFSIINGSTIYIRLYRENEGYYENSEENKFELISPNISIGKREFDFTDGSEEITTSDAVTITNNEAENWALKIQLNFKNNENGELEFVYPSIEEVSKLLRKDYNDHNVSAKLGTHSVYKFIPEDDQFLNRAGELKITRQIKNGEDKKIAIEIKDNEY